MIRLHIVLTKVTGKSSIISSSQEDQHQPWEKSLYFFIGDQNKFSRGEMHGGGTNSSHLFSV